MANRRTAVIVGSGVGGLALANILAKAGYEVTVYEKNDTAGGRMGVIKKKGFTFDTGPSWYLMKDVFTDYFRLFGKTTSNYYDLARLDPAYRVFFETMDPTVIKGNMEADTETFESLEHGAASRLRKYVTRAESNYNIALKYFLYNPFKRPSNLLKKDLLLALPGFAGVFTRSLHGYVSSNFRRKELQQILEYPSVFLGASPFNTPALYQLMSYLDFNEGVFYPKKKGMYAVADALCKLGAELGVEYKFNSDVTKIVVKDGNATGIIANKSFVSADIVVSNADLHFTETQLLDQKHQSYPAKYWKKRKAGPSALLLFLGVKGSLPELEHHNLFFVKDWRQNFDQIYKYKSWPKSASMYVSKTTATDKSTAPKNHENVFVLVPLPSGASPGRSEIDKLIEVYLAQLEELSGIKDLRQRIVLKEIYTPDHFGDAFNSWLNTALGMSHTLRQSAFLRPSVKSKKVDNLYYVGAGSQPGIGVPMCIISAQLVYKYLVQDWSSSAPSTIERSVL